jgi:uncharacterized repeat protein (TIGR01451 family)
LVSTCPTAAQVAAIGAQFELTFSTDPTASAGLACTAAGGSADLTLEQERVYQALLLAQSLSFSQPLPWTSMSLYGWMSTYLKGISVSDAYPNDFCCITPGVINLTTEPAAFDAGFPPVEGLIGLLAVIVHETRHAQGIPHDCGNGTEDQTYTELGAWGVQASLELWMAFYSGQFFDSSTGSAIPEYNRTDILYLAWRLFATEFCDLPSSDLSIVASAPRYVQHDAPLSYQVTVSNSGPDPEPGVFLDEDPPAGLVYQSASSSQGACSSPAVGAGGPTVCALGALAVGARVTATLTYLATAPPGTIIGGQQSSNCGGLCTGGPRVIGTADDANDADMASVSTTVVGPPSFSMIQRLRTERRDGRLIISTGFNAVCPLGASGCLVRGEATTSGPSGARLVVGRLQTTLRAGWGRLLSFALDKQGVELLHTRKHLRLDLSATIDYGTQVVRMSKVIAISL